MRILVTGSREWTDREVLEDALDDASVMMVAEAPESVTVVHGGARGADRLAGKWGDDAGVWVEEHEAKWRGAGFFDRTAGFARNQHMVDLGADICLAFFKNGAVNKGTSDCVRRVEAAGIPVRRFYG